MASQLSGVCAAYEDALRSCQRPWAIADGDVNNQLQVYFALIPHSRLIFDVNSQCRQVAIAITIALDPRLIGLDRRISSHVSDSLPERRRRQGVFQTENTSSRSDGAGVKPNDRSKWKRMLGRVKGWW